MFDAEMHKLTTSKDTVNEIYRNKILEAILDDILRRFMWRHDTEDQDALVELAKMGKNIC
jgi:hypothetical protein